MLLLVNLGNIVMNKLCLLKFLQMLTIKYTLKKLSPFIEEKHRRPIIKIFQLVT